MHDNLNSLEKERNTKIEQWAILQADPKENDKLTSSLQIRTQQHLRLRWPFVTLFVLALKTLSCILKRVEEGSFISSFKVGGRGGKGIEVPHLLFADNTLFFVIPVRSNWSTWAGHSYGLKQHDVRQP